MATFVQITKHPVSGLTVVPNENNPAFASIRVESKDFEFKNGFAREVKLSALIQGTEEVLNSIVAGKSVLPGKIVVVETTTPKFEGQQPKINPVTEETCTVGGLPIYRNTEYTTDLTRQSVFIAHDNIMANAGVASAAGNGLLQNEN